MMFKLIFLSLLLDYILDSINFEYTEKILNTLLNQEKPMNDPSNISLIKGRSRG